ncbi:MAG: SAM-dependent DNA methyltransferase [Tepidisphaerales bacterium]
MRSRQRVIDHGEVFTPPKLVSDMLDLVAHECERLDSRFLEPACGDGAFLVEVLRRKLRTATVRHRKNADRWTRDAFIAVSSLYGVELLPDNVAACRARLLEAVTAAFREQFGRPMDDAPRDALAYVLSVNILQGDALTLKDAAGRPIVFPEWSMLPGGRVKRRDYAFHELIEPHRGKVEWSAIESDEGRKVFLPQAVRNYPLCPYVKVAEQAVRGVAA